jgi:hypothetical protein
MFIEVPERDYGIFPGPGLLLPPGRVVLAVVLSAPLIPPGRLASKTDCLDRCVVRGRVGFMKDARGDDGTAISARQKATNEPEAPPALEFGD